MFQAHLFSYFGVRNFFVWKRFATMRSYDNMFHGFCSTRKCFQQRLISFRSVLSDTTQELLLLSIRLQNCSFYNHLLFDRTDFCLRSNWLLVSIETTFDRNDLQRQATTQLFSPIFNRHVEYHSFMKEIPSAVLAHCSERWTWWITYASLFC